jgi:hypothetical protein
MYITGPLCIVRLNLMGSELYCPSMAWEANTWTDGRVMADLLVYMDDFSHTGPDREE